MAIARRPRLPRRAKPLALKPPAESAPAPAPRAKALKPPSEPEPEALVLARARLQKLFQKVSKGRPQRYVYLTLAILNQASGSHRAANTIIDEFELDKRFGLKKFEFENEP